MPTLEPVEGNPFDKPKGPTLEPVDGNPFASDAAMSPTGIGPVPQAFIDRVANGLAIKRVMDKAVGGFKEGLGNEPVTGLSDETVQQGINIGIFHDPVKGGPTAIQLANEAMIMPVSKAFETLMRGANAGLHGAGAAIGQIVDELGASKLDPGLTGERARKEIINAGNWAMIESGFGRFSRPAAHGDVAIDHPIGTLPTPVEFKNAAEVLGKPEAEANLKQLWQEQGIHPAEAVHDAQADAFLKHDLTSRDTYLADQVAKWQSGVSGGADLDALPEAVMRLGKPIEGDTTLYRGEWPGRPDLGNEVGTISASDRAGGNSFSLARNEWALDENKPLPMSEIKIPAGTKVLNVASMKLENSGEMETMLPPGKYKLVGSHIEPAKFENYDGTKAVHEIKTYEFEPSTKAHSLGAAATEAPTDVPLTVQPAAPAGRLSAAVKDAGDKLFDIMRDAQMGISPMATGTRDSMAMAKDFANTMRKNRWDWTRIDDDIAKRFTPEQRTRMWNAADEESVARQLGESTEHQGLVTLEPEERAAVEDLQSRAQRAWTRARDIGMVEGEGLPAYTPRMVINAAGAGAKEGALPLNSIGSNLKIRTAQMMHRAHMTAEETEAAAKGTLGEGAAIARDIRALPLATAKLEDAIAGRTLIENIKDYGKRSGNETVHEGSIPVDSEAKWFTLDHPAFKTWRPKYEKLPNGDPALEGNMLKAVKDADGNVIFEQVPLFVHGDFEGPLRAVLDQRSGPIYQGLMSLKGKTMSLIMNSPLIHNAVEFGRAFPAMPTRIVKAYFDGNRAKNDVAVMHEAIDAGLVPIGKRFFKQDITSVMEAPDLTPGRSWTSKVLAAVPGLFDEAAGTAVKRAVDKAGDFWHNTLLWDRIGDLQMGLYVNLRSDIIGKGVDPQAASRIAAHFANRYAGALPKEAMSDAARKVANLTMFSRTFTLGNVGAMKDVLTGLPRDVLAQIERDLGVKAGSINEAGIANGPEVQAVQTAKAIARRKAFATVMLDVGLLYVGNSVLQSALNVMLMDSSLDQEMHGYAKRAKDVLNRVEMHPASLLQPFDLAERLSATHENEPGKSDRLKIGYGKDGTAIYARSPFGKIGEEFTGYLTAPLDMIRKKQSTLARPVLQVLNNDKGFGRKIYDPNAETPADKAGVMWAIIEHFAKAQTPEGQINALGDLVKGDGDPKVNALQAFGPIAGVTFSKGAPGGPAVGELYHDREMHNFKVDQSMPDIKKQILRGDMSGAYQAMNTLGIPPGLQRFYVRTTVNPATRLSPRSLRDFYNYSTPEQRARMEQLRSAGPMAPQQ